MRVRPHYDEQFKESAIELLERTERSFPQVAQDLGVSEWTLRDWYKKRGMAKKKKGKQSGPAAALKALQGDETPEQRLARLERENAALRRENDSLKMDREILKKAAAYSSSQGNRR
jgi:transposase